MRTAFVDALVTTLDPASPRASGVLVDGGRIEALLDTRPVGLSADTRIVECQGGALLPGFHDCHVHLTDTGLLAGKHDVRDCSDIAAIVRRVGALCADRSNPADPLYAGNYDEQLIAERRPPLARELDVVTGSAPVVLTRVDGHSCVVNSAAFAELGVEALRGVERDESGAPSGRLREAANYAAQNGIIERLSSDTKHAADERATQIALRAGITTAHNVIVGEQSLEALEARYRYDAALPIRVISKSCSMNVRKVARLGRRVFGGDIFVDGSIGSRTAALHDPYHDQPGEGQLYLTREQLFELFDEAAEHGLSLGVHAIGDRALDAAVGAWEDVIAKRGPLHEVRPSIDHFEIAPQPLITRAAKCGMLLSMQPAFDHLWGGDEGMYAARLGVARARGMNLFKTAARAGCTVCGGSDSPVTPFSALLGMQSLMAHHIAAERFSLEEALRAYTSEAAKLSFDEGRRGVLAPGYDADFVVLERALDSTPIGAIADARIALTVVAGEIKYSALQ